MGCRVMQLVAGFTRFDFFQMLFCDESVDECVECRVLVRETTPISKWYRVVKFGPHRGSSGILVDAADYHALKRALTIHFRTAITKFPYCRASHSASNTKIAALIDITVHTKMWLATDSMAKISHWL